MFFFRGKFKIFQNENNYILAISCMIFLLDFNNGNLAPVKKRFSETLDDAADGSYKIG